MEEDFCSSCGNGGEAGLATCGGGGGCTFGEDNEEYNWDAFCSPGCVDDCIDNWVGDAISGTISSTISGTISFAGDASTSSFVVEKEVC